MPNCKDAPFHTLELPEAPADLTGPVKAWLEPVRITTFEPGEPDLNPMFLEKRVYQGSSGTIYPLPYFDRIATEPAEREWDAIHIENEYLRLMILPEIGGRIHIGYDKTTGYDFFYRQNVIKPALVGLAGPWISGGVEFNWPQHHRPATFMPVNTLIEKHDDGSVTVWCSDHDPLLRMKGMHGIRLHPGRAVLELHARLYNRTPLTQTFLWWANVATRVHERYQSFFPTDVRYVADHAKRAVTTFPLSDRPYYGVDYAGRAADGVPVSELPAHFVPDGAYAANDLSWYANIPVPTSYMITGTADDFFGGYDHAREAGVVHVANHHIAPGKKQWTWGNHEFGYAWDRSLTESDGPYIELMAGVYTDNQPDFSFLAPWETKTFVQSWFPIHRIGVPQSANTDAALHVDLQKDGVHIGLQVTRDEPEITIVLSAGGRELLRESHAVTVVSPLLLVRELHADIDLSSVALTVYRRSKILIAFNPANVKPATAPETAEEPLEPAKIATVEELFLTGSHLTQYRHATRSPLPYWKEALHRDPSESRTHNALGLWHFRRGEMERAAHHFSAAKTRLTRLNANPYDGEPFYNLGLSERMRGNLTQAYGAFYKATWNAAWRAPAYFALAEMNIACEDWTEALDHLQRCLRCEADHLNARHLLVRTFRSLDRVAEADQMLQETAALDPLDTGSLWLTGNPPATAQEHLDLAFDLLRAGLNHEALLVLDSALQHAGPREGAVPMIHFIAADIHSRLNDGAAAQHHLEHAQTASLDYCFPSRLEELFVLERTLERWPNVASAAYLLGNLLYDRQRHTEAIAHWERAVTLQPSLATAWRNLGIARFNIEQNQTAAENAFERALAANPGDSRILYERDQLWKRTGKEPQLRLEELERHPGLVELRDDLSIEKATLLNHLCRPAEALHLLLACRFQPWEGGEGLVLAQYIRAQLLLGRAALEAGDTHEALRCFAAAGQVPENLSEAKHLLANHSDIDFWLGEAFQQEGQHPEAQSSWQRAADQRGDFQAMAVRHVSDMTFWSGMALLRLERRDAALKMFHAILKHADDLENITPKIDYFATSLPAMLLFNDDLARRQQVEVLLLRAQGLAGLGRWSESLTLLEEVLAMDKNQAAAADLRSILSSRMLEFCR